MCGFAGFLGGQWPGGRKEARVQLIKMNKSISHRGPDSDGYWCDADSGIALGHRRLAIVDLSPTGYQPMVSADGRFVIVFNGEIYNHVLLRDSLEKLRAFESFSWRGRSDTETLLAGFSEWGIQGTVERCIGMFAFAVWDRETHRLTLSRDRLGEKPLYYGWQGIGRDSTFLFGSELKALKAHPIFSAEIDRGSLCLLMRHSYVPTPYSIYQGIRKLPPGALLTVSMASRDAEPLTFWSAAEVASHEVVKPVEKSSDQLIDELDSLLRSAVKQQMMADVPLGAFLSGGVDSSTVVALMQAQSERPVRTFTIGFNEDGYNEALHAKAVAAHLGTEHTELYVTHQQALDVIPRLPILYCEPFSDSSQIPTFLLSALAREHVAVSLSGDAGDELFCGYNRYVLAQNLWGILSKIPAPIRRMAAGGIHSLSPGAWDSLLGPLKGVLPKSLRQTNLGDKLNKGASVMASNDLNELYLGLISHWSDPTEVVLGASEPPTLLNLSAPTLAGLDGVQRMMVLDTMTYLPDDILVKVDRAAMGVSLETRVPFLDHRVVEFAWRLPQSMKLRDGMGKWALRQVLYRYVPKALIERPKMGFGVPMDAWLRGPLREWAEELLGESRLRHEGFFNPAPIRQKWEEHLSGRRNWQNHLWNVLMFQAWLEAQN
jgi:asparagine synthase (glutamine-hydrolysing)